jgi:hypothetical protein
MKNPTWNQWVLLAALGLGTAMVGCGGGGGGGGTTDGGGGGGLDSGTHDAGGGETDGGGGGTDGGGGGETDGGGGGETDGGGGGTDGGTAQADGGGGGECSAMVGTDCNESPAGSFMAPECCGETTLCIPNAAPPAAPTRHYCTKICTGPTDCPTGSFCVTPQAGAPMICVLPQG